MYFNRYIFYFFLGLSLIASSCEKEASPNSPGTIALVFNHTVSDDDLSLRTPGDQTFDYIDASGQEYNISKFGYYISEIRFSGTDGLGYADPKKITTDATKLTGFYHVLESDPSSQRITVQNVTSRTYDRIEFTIGIKSYTVIPGPPGGILDPGNGSWFLNMNAGYVNLAIEGNAVNSGQEFISAGSEPEILEGTFSIHSSGWIDVAAEPGQNPIFVDNTKTIELLLDEEITVEDGLAPEVHIDVNLAEILDGIDFSQTYAVDSQNEGQFFSNKFVDAFTLDFVRQ